MIKLINKLWNMYFYLFIAKYTFMGQATKLKTSKKKMHVYKHTMNALDAFAPAVVLYTYLIQRRCKHKIYKEKYRMFAGDS